MAARPIKFKETLTEEEIQNQLRSDTYFHCERLHATMPKLACYKRQEGRDFWDCEKCPQGKSIRKEVMRARASAAADHIMKKREDKNQDKEKERVGYSIRIDGDNSVIGQYPDLEELLLKSAMGHVRTVENQALWYILQGLQKDGFGKENQDAKS